MNRRICLFPKPLKKVQKIWEPGGASESLSAICSAYLQAPRRLLERLQRESHPQRALDAEVFLSQIAKQNHSVLVISRTSSMVV